MLLLLFLLIEPSFALESVLSRAVDSATRRAELGDSLCHGTHAAAPDKDSYMNFVRRAATAQDNEPDHLLRTLYEYCRADPRCCELYYLDNCNTSSNKSAAARTAMETYGELDMFRYLTPWLDKTYPLTQLLDDGGACGSSPHTAASTHNHLSAVTYQPNENVMDLMLRRAWVNEMKLQAYERGQVHCAQNQKFIFSPQDGEGRCVCASSDDDCHAAFRRQSLSPWTYSTSALIVSGVAVFVLIGLEIYKVALEIPIFRKLYASMRAEKVKGGGAAEVTQNAKTFTDALSTELAASTAKNKKT